MTPERFIPLVVEFVTGTSIEKEEKVESPLPILRNGLPGTFVRFPNGRKIGVPSDQVVLSEDDHGAARLGFGGMSFEGMEGEHFVFWRVKDLLPEEQLSMERGHKMLLEPAMISSIRVRGSQVWPPAEASHA